ncbi:MAG: metal ABC transporter ATP-binding protein [Cyanobacteriota bacterium]|nr:metal ABC transporter ATP-binding protein [Cyanobacteriota bacterium]
MLEVCNLAVRYRQTWAVRDLSFSLQPGQLTGLLGPNGAGKSTVLKALLGLLPTANGTIRFNDRPLPTQLKRVAYIPQRTQIDWDYPITVQNVVMMGRVRATGWLRSPGRRSREIVREALTRVGMWDYRQRQIRQLSGGQQQRVFLARALAQQAELFFFDEPFSGIDKQTETILFEVFAELKAEGKTLLVVSHDLGDTLEHYDRILLLDRQLIAAGTQREVLTSENLQKAYGLTVSKLLV